MSDLKLRPLAVGDPVIHKATGLCGTVEAVETYSTTDTQMVSVALLNGKRMRGIRREEFGLHAAGVAQRAEQQPKDVREDAARTLWPTEFAGPISDASILSELM